MTTHAYKGRSIKIELRTSIGAWSYCCAAGNDWSLAGIRLTPELAIEAAQDAIDRFDREEEQSIHQKVFNG